uniref:Uncharacterized protein n=1 Tax=Timema shepardi TaxID=629360 RepID=A0A7R9B580_TIMSH|nr:unnamed protein product [Timema shepardi]
MQLSAADMKPGVNVQVSANQGLYFSQQTSPPESCYTVSQSQTINFTQQSMRQRPQQTRPAGVVESSLVAQQHATLLQQQQILRAQHQQQQQAAAAAQQQHLMGPVPRGPPPEYKPSPQLIHGLMGQQQRFAVASSRQRTQQPMPASGPMMRPQQQNQALHGGGSMFMPGMPGMGTQHHSMAPQHRLPGYARPTPNTRPPNVAIGQDGMGRGVPGDWRHVFMSQQQQQGVMYSNPQMRANYQHQGGQFSVQGGHQMSAAAVQMQQMNRSPVNQMQMLTQQQQVAMGLSQQGPGPAGPTPNQMSMNMQMNQAMSVSGGGGSPHPHHHPSNNPQQQSVGYTGSPGPAPTTPSSSIPAEFSLELLDNFPTGGDGGDLFLDPGAAFNLHDIL